MALVSGRKLETKIESSSDFKHALPFPEQLWSQGTFGIPQDHLSVYHIRALFLCDFALYYLEV